jgi:hypothetical protein
MGERRFGFQADREGSGTTRLGIVQPSTDNATTEEDYRTALLSDSPHGGCSLCG